MDGLGLPTENGRLIVDEYLNLPGHSDVFAFGDAAAVPDSTRPGQYTPDDRQHAVRQGKQVALNIAASFGSGAVGPYRHHDLGFVVGLGSAKAAANPLNVPLSGGIAAAVTAGYHLFALPGDRVRVAAHWLLNAVGFTTSRAAGTGAFRRRPARHLFAGDHRQPQRQEEDPVAVTLSASCHQNVTLPQNN